MQNEQVDITDRLTEASTFALMDAARDTVLEARREILTLRNMVAAYELAFQRLLQVQMAMLGDKIADDAGMIIDANQLGYPTVRDWDGLIEGFRESKP